MLLRYKVFPVILICLVLLYLYLSFWGIKTKLDSHDLTWFCYKSGDTLIFRNSDNVFDTILILETRIWHSSFNPIEVHDTYNPQIGDMYYTSSKLMYSGKKMKLISLVKESPNKPAIVSIELHNSYFLSDRDEFILVDSHSLSDQLYRDIYRIKKNKMDQAYLNNNHSKAIANSTISELFWSKSIGLVRYVTMSDETWELVHVLRTAE